MYLWGEKRQRRLSREECATTPQLNSWLARVYKNWRPRQGGDRREEVVMAQLRSGPCPATGYYSARIGNKDQAVCGDCGEEEIKDHILESPRWRKHRFKWKLAGRVEDLDEIGVVEYLREVRPEWFD